MHQFISIFIFNLPSKVCLSRCIHTCKVGSPRVDCIQPSLYLSPICLADHFTTFLHLNQLSRHLLFPAAFVSIRATQNCSKKQQKHTFRLSIRTNYCTSRTFQAGKKHSSYFYFMFLSLVLRLLWIPQMSFLCSCYHAYLIWIFQAG